MDVYVRDRNFEVIAIIDTYVSLLWVERYRGAGEFTIIVPASMDAMKWFQKDNYLTIKESNIYMLVEYIELSTDETQGDLMKITGKSLESLLSRHLIYQHLSYNGNFQNAIQDVLNKNAINPSDGKRKIPGLTFAASSNPLVTQHTIDTQWFGNNLYEAIYNACEEKDIGFDIVATTGGNFYFTLTGGVDRSYAQGSNAQVVFSPKYDNLAASNYATSNNKLKTVAWVHSTFTVPAVKDENGKIVQESYSYDVETETYLSSNKLSGFERRELYVDAGSKVRSKIDNDTYLSMSEFLSRLQSEGRTQLAQYSRTEVFDGVIEPNVQFIYGKDYFLGDIVQVENEYGRTAPCRVVEYAISDSESGYVCVPSFTNLLETSVSDIN